MSASTCSPAPFRGKHHITGRVYASSTYGIRCGVFAGLSTYDGDELTRLVILAHDRCVRVELASSGPGRVGIMLHKRHTREGCIMEKHPTIEDAIASVRGTGR